MTQLATSPKVFIGVGLGIAILRCLIVRGEAGREAKNGNERSNGDSGSAELYSESPIMIVGALMDR